MVHRYIRCCIPAALCAINLTMGNNKSTRAEPAQPKKSEGWTETKYINPEQLYCDQVKEDFFRRSGVIFTKYEAIAYRLQYTDWINYLVKVWYTEDVEDGYAHLLINVPMPDTIEDIRLEDFESHKTLQDPLIPW